MNYLEGFSMLIYLCDDSESDTLRLKHYLNTYAKQMKLCFEVFSFSSGDKLLAAFKQANQKPELIFLDIFMANLNGIEVARYLRNMHYQGGIIFTTSSTEHAMDSYEVHALYYLQKPYERKHFENAMSRCSVLLQKAKPLFTFTRKKKEFSISYENIIFFETGQSHTVILHTTSDSYSFSGTLTQITEFFKEIDYFLSVGQSFLINLNHVSGQIENDLVMSDGSIVQIPLRKRKDILTFIETYQKELPL